MLGVKSWMLIGSIGVLILVVAKMNYSGRYIDVAEIKRLFESRQESPKPAVMVGGKALADTFDLQVSDGGFQGLSLEEAQLLFARYCTTITENCSNKTRFGGRGDGAYDVCLTPEYRPIPGNCIVYSFGILHDWSFDDAVRAYGCEVHSFDPSIGKQDHVRGKNHFFHNQGLWDKDIINEHGWKLSTLGSIMKQLGHEGKVIDVIKADVEGAEWPFIHQLISSDWSSSIRQLVFELHTPVFKESAMTVGLFQTVYNDLTAMRDDHGFRLHKYVHNNNCCPRFAMLTPAHLISGIDKLLCCYEVYFVNHKLRRTVGE